MKKFKKARAQSSGKLEGGSQDREQRKEKALALFNNDVVSEREREREIKRNQEVEQILKGLFVMLE